MSENKRYAFGFQETQVTSKEDILGYLGGQREYHYYSVKEPFEGVTDNSTVVLQIQMTINQQKQIIERSVYTALDLLGDVGGLFDALKSICSAVLFVLFYATRAGPHNYIIKRLFKK